MANKIVVLNGGKIEQVGSPMDLYNHPATPFVAGFIGSPKMNLYTGATAAAEGCATYGIRPEHVTLSPDGGKWQGKVRHVEHLGADTVVYLDVPGLGELVARVTGQMQIAHGDVTYASPVAEREFRFA